MFPRKNDLIIAKIIVSVYNFFHYFFYLSRNNLLPIRDIISFDY